MKLTKDTAIKVLKLMGTEFEQQSSDWYNAKCPFAPWTHASGKDSSPSFGIHASGKVKCFTCLPAAQSINVAAIELYKLNNHIPLIQIEELLKGAELSAYITQVGWNEPPPGTEKPWPEHALPDDELSSEAVEYLLARNIWPEDLAMFDVRFDAAKNMIVWPVRNWLGLLCGAQGRAISKHSKMKHFNYPGPGWRNPMVWGNEHLVERDDPVLIVEGHFDLVTTSRVYPNTLATMTASPEHNRYARLGSCPRIVTLLDPGVGGDTGRAAWSKWGLMNGREVDHVKLTAGDPNDVGEEVIAEALSSHLEVAL